MKNSESGPRAGEQPKGFPPCPGCGKVGFSVQEWVGEDQVQMWKCNTNSEECRVEQYRPRDCDPQGNRVRA